MHFLSIAFNSIMPKRKHNIFLATVLFHSPVAKIIAKIADTLETTVKYVLAQLLVGSMNLDNGLYSCTASSFRFATTESPANVIFMKILLHREDSLEIYIHSLKIQCSAVQCHFQKVHY